MKPLSKIQLLICLLLLLLSASVRIATIDVQGFWYDESFTKQFTDASVAQMLRRTAFDVHPPFYYLGLIGWRKLIGDTPIAIRLYSTFWSLCGMLILVALARELFGNRTAIVALLFSSVHPLEIYFAQEARMYMQAMVLVLLTTWMLWRWMQRVHNDRRWRRWILPAGLYALFAILLIYTHYSTVFVLLAQGIVALAFFAWRRCWVAFAVYLGVGALSVLTFVPWLIFKVHVSGYFYNPALRWIPRPLPSDMFSFLGREFLAGYFTFYIERWWSVAIFISMALLVMACRPIVSDWKDKTETRISRPSAAVMYLIGLLFLPVVLAWLASYVYRPVYFRPRYCLLALPPFILLCAFACSSLKSMRVRSGLTGLLFLTLASATALQFYVPLKVNRDIAERWPTDKKPAQVVAFPQILDSTLSLYTEAEWHSGDREYIEKLLPYLGGAEIWVIQHNEMYSYEPPERRQYCEWLLGLGSVKRTELSAELILYRVSLPQHLPPSPYEERFDRLFIPVEYTNVLNGFVDDRLFYRLELDAEYRPFRWSKPVGWIRFNCQNAGTLTLNVEFPPSPSAEYRPDLHFYQARTLDGSELLNAKPVKTIAHYRKGAFDVSFDVPHGNEPLVILWTMNGVNLQEAGLSADYRDLGLRVNWIGWKSDEATSALH